MSFLPKGGICFRRKQKRQDPDIGLEKSVLAIPPLLAVGAIHHYLIQQGLRFTADLFFLGLG